MIQESDGQIRTRDPWKAKNKAKLVALRSVKKWRFMGSEASIKYRFRNWSYR